MDARTALVVGGGMAAAASVAVATVFAVTGAVALADRPGAALAGSNVVVSGASHPAGGVSAPLGDAPVTVPAPAPEVIVPKTAAPARTAAPGTGAASDSATSQRSAGRQDSQGVPGPGQKQDGNAQGRQSPPSGSQGDQGQNAQQRLASDAAKWRDHITEQVRRLAVQIQDSASRAVQTSEQGSPRTLPGSQKRQSPRSPDNGD